MEAYTLMGYAAIAIPSFIAIVALYDYLKEIIFNKMCDDILKYKNKQRTEKIFQLKQQIMNNRAQGKFEEAMGLKKDLEDL